MRRLAASLCVLVAAGCGGGGDDRLSQEEFEQRANAICTELEQALDAMGQVESPDQLAQQLEQGERELTNAIDELRELEPPEESQEGYDRFLAAADELTQVVRDMRDAALTGNVGAVQQHAARANEVSDRADEAATGVGLDDCADN